LDELCLTKMPSGSARIVFSTNISTRFAIFDAVLERARGVYERGLWQQDAYPVRNRCPRLGQRITCDIAIYQQ
jgi:hypothetical protein